MKEKDFIKSVNGRLPPTVHRQSMTFAALTNNGTPDYYYDCKYDLWVEYKAVEYRRVIPLDVTALQRIWLTRRHNAGGNAVLIVGAGTEIGKKRYGVILDSPAWWELDRIELAEHNVDWIPVETVVNYIYSRCIHGRSKNPCVSGIPVE